MWVSTAGGGMVWAGSAPHEAALAIRTGRARTVVNVFSVAWATQRADMGRKGAREVVTIQHDFIADGGHNAEPTAAECGQG